jgi:hypothetical protein
MAERFMITGYDRRNPGGRIPAQIIQEVCRVIWTYAFHDLGEHELGLADRDVEVAVRLAGHSADLNRKMGGLPSKVKLRRLFGQAPGNATNTMAL